VDLVPKSTTKENEISRERSPRITCNISRAFWEKVCLSFFILDSSVTFIIYRTEHFY
jgi:hypothetical protein